MNVRKNPSITSRTKRAIKIRIRNVQSKGSTPSKRSRRLHDVSATATPAPTDAMSAFEAAATHIDDSPVLILSAGWRSGSTLLQRLVVSSGSVLVWGEPYNYSSPVENLMKMIPALDPDVFTEKWIIGQHPSNKPLMDRFIANLFPPKESFVAAHRAFLQTLFGSSAREQGYKRWGIKEVRWNAEHARYLRALFPEARMVFLVRNPFDSYASYSGSQWYWSWPDDLVTTAEQFGNKWTELAGGFLEQADQLGALLVKYEDLIERPETLSQVEDHLGLRFDKRLMSDNLGLSTRTPLDDAATEALTIATSAAAERFGYRP